MSDIDLNAEMDYLHNFIALYFGWNQADVFDFQEEFLKDVMQFLLHRGHTRLIPQGGLAEFPDAILNSKRLDVYNLYREVFCGFICHGVTAFCCRILM